MKKQKIKLVTFIVLLASVSINFYSQNSKLLLDKSGSWKVVDWGVYTHYNCGFTKTETSANYQKLLNITERARQNPVFLELKGFDCLPTFFARSCNNNYFYGIPSFIHFEFHTWSLNKAGKEIRWDIEPPHWDISVNNLRLDMAGEKASSNVPPSEAKKGFNKTKFDDATNRMNALFQTPGLKETIAPGVDRYGEMVIIYNPSRPAYWEQVTLKEVYQILLDYWQAYPDEITSNITVEMLNQTYDSFSESEKNGFAYASGALMGEYGSDDSHSPIVRVNSAYWNKKLPRSSVQIISFKCPADKDYLDGEMKANLKNNGGTYHVNRFLKSLDPLMFTNSIDK